MNTYEVNEILLRDNEINIFNVIKEQKEYESIKTVIVDNDFEGNTLPFIVKDNDSNFIVECSDENCSYEIVK